MIDDEMRAAAEVLRTEFSEGTVMVDVRVLSEIIKAVAALHKLWIEEGRVKEDNPQLAGQMQMGVVILKMYQAVIAKHADEIAAAKFRQADIDSALKAILKNREQSDEDEATS